VHSAGANPILPVEPCDWPYPFCFCFSRPFMILIAGYTISALGSNLPATLILYYVEYVLQARHAEVFLLIYFFDRHCISAAVDCGFPENR
jgi:Na+/melibiose symporter-like transporter